MIQGLKLDQIYSLKLYNFCAQKNIIVSARVKKMTQLHIQNNLKSIL
jgi:hypothetical protein